MALALPLELQKGAKQPLRAGVSDRADASSPAREEWTRTTGKKSEGFVRAARRRRIGSHLRVRVNSALTIAELRTIVGEFFDLAPGSPSARPEETTFALL